MKMIRELLGIKKTSFDHYESIEGWLTPSEANGLLEIAGLLKADSSVVEIGSWKGKSTFCIGMGLRKGTIYCIDPFNAAGEEGSKEIYEKTKGEKTLLDQFKNNMKSLPRKVEIEILKGYSHEFIHSINHKIDFLFIDGDHSIEGCKFDYLNYYPMLKEGGFLAFHDYDSSRKDLGPTWVIENLVNQNKEFEFYKKFDSLMVFKKII